MFDWRNIFRGMAMGASDVVPGVSGGTIAVLLGIYDQFINALSGITTREWKKHLPFLVMLGAGMGISIIALSNLIEWLLEVHPQPTYFFFIGLIGGILPYLLRESNAKENFKAKHIAMLLVGAVIVLIIGFSNPSEEGAIITELTAGNMALLFGAGILASSAMMLPGISGSFLLLVLGVYNTAIAAISNFNLPVIALVGAGVAFGFIFTSKLIRYLMNRYPVMMYAFIIGLVFGSLFVVYPGLALSAANVIMCAVTLAAGFYVAVLLGRSS
ncbi:hypothetical protein KP77_06350 [Jeotgalibacillus alimentarius]|uniref:DUF368 domain-containing protein n=1 Tax=Jeotgalibacillus alimentarius TaxID=135826 RepID=A0A0C2W9A6_9BACL|nr:DUF368 domain-containing protein [Jeotgalibacillus alimentarius]KIL52608.1 hypothetical protein KP77_06350 [Jeotgalibacillus alimentarius]